MLSHSGYACNHIDSLTPQTIRFASNIGHHVGKVLLDVEPARDPGAAVRAAVLVQPLKLHMHRANMTMIINQMHVLFMNEFSS